MSGLNVNCFGQCLNSLEDNQDNPNFFKAKKGRQCLTLVKKNKPVLNTARYEKNPLRVEGNNRMQENKSLQRVQMVSLVQKPETNIVTRPIYHPHVIYQRYSTGNVSNQINNRLIRPINTHVQRERRFSEIKYISYQSKQMKSKERPNSLKHVKIAQVKKEYEQQTLATEHHNHQIQVIKQEIENQRRSSFFQGAKSIISKINASRKNADKREIEQNIFQTAQKANKYQIRNFYDNARLCETQHGINNTHSSIKTEHYEECLLLPLKMFRQISIDDIPMSPKPKLFAKYKDIKIGKLLGVGKWAHVYVCQEANTNCIYSFKEIFKQSLQQPVTVQKIHQNLEDAISIIHPKIITIYSKIETKDRICLIMQYCSRSIYDQLKVRGRFSIHQIKSYSADLVEGLVYLHQNDLAHGNVNIFSTFIHFSECKIKPNFIQVAQQDCKKLDFKTDIIALGVILHQMAYGISIEVSHQQTLYKKEKYYRQKEMRQKLIRQIKRHIQQEQFEEDYSRLNAFIMMLINWSPEVRLASCICLNHPFMREENKR